MRYSSPSRSLARVLRVCVRLACGIVVALVLAASAATNLAARQQAAASTEPSPAPSAPLPFRVGERLEYDVEAKWFLIGGGGTASYAVEAIDTVHGHPSYRLVFAMKGGITVFKMNDVQRSWLDADQLFARRFEQKLDQTNYERDRTYDFFPDRMRYEEVGKPGSGGALATATPLDDVSFLYFVRTLPLVVGEEYTEPRYYKRDGNPITVRVLRTERVTVPAGEFDAVVVQPIIRTKGMFSEGGEAEVWLTNDELRLPLKLRAKVSIATLTMELTSYTIPSGGR